MRLLILALFAALLAVSTVALPTTLDAPTTFTLSRRSTSAQSASNSTYPPSTDPFYTPPSDFGSAENGAILKSRNISTALNRLATAYQVLYKTTDALNGSDATVSTLFVPLQPVSPPQIMLYLSELNSSPSHRLL
jgi:hypothetical protein